MNRKVVLLTVALGSILGRPGSLARAEAPEQPGLVGIQYGSEDFTDPENLVIRSSFDQTWTQDDGNGRQWSARWQGSLVGPVTGVVKLTVETDQKAEVEIDGKVVTSAPVTMVKGQKYPVTVSFVKTGDGYDCYLRVKWSWAGQAPSVIGGSSLVYAADVEAKLDEIVAASDDDDDDEDEDGNGQSLDLNEIFAQEDDSANAKMPGLVGIICEDEGWEEPASQDIIKHANHNWTGGPGNWSGYWQGYLEAPATGEVTFTAEVDNGIKLAIDDTVVIEGLSRSGGRTGKYAMVKGKKYPLRLWYFQEGDPSYLRLYWRWEGRDKIIIDERAFSYSPADSKFAVSKLPGDYWDDRDAPFHYDGTGSEPLDLAFQDGRLNPVVGVENYQVFRNNREHPERYTGGMNKTYIHAPMICYWKGKYYLEFLAAPVNEHDANTETYMTSSVDGRNWEMPRNLFPAFKPHDDKYLTICHQRMGFYVSRNDRLLILAFYGKHPSPNKGNGVGRAVREVYEDGSVGPLYFIRYNRHAGYNETNTPHPYYKTARDKGFVAICNELMADKLMVQQWWEEDRSTDGFYILSGEQFKCKAFNWYTRKDGGIVGLFKAGYSVFSKDGGKTWSDIMKIPSVIVGHAKMWGQKTEDGRYAFVWNPHFEWRYPLVVATGDDGRSFSNMACVHGELPFMRYQGDAKDVGPQYVRGISPGNGDPPGKDMWLAYSMNKEDIWVSRVPLPLRHKVDKPVNDNFDRIKAAATVTDWNIYSLIWAPVEVVKFPTDDNKSLKLSDKDPYDYARAVRVFPAGPTVTAKFDILAKQKKHGAMEVEILSSKGTRPVRIMLNDRGMVQTVNGQELVDLTQYRPGRWLKFEINADATRGRFNILLNGKEVLKKGLFAELAWDMQRLSFRTGSYRKLGIGNKENEDDLPNAGDPVTEAVYYIDNVSIAR